MILDHEYSQSGRICTGGGHIKWSCLSAPQWLSGGREPVIRSRRRSAKRVFPNLGGRSSKGYAFQIRRSRLCLAIPDNNLAAP